MGTNGHVSRACGAKSIFTTALGSTLDGRVLAWWQGDILRGGGRGK